MVSHWLSMCLSVHPSVRCQYVFLFPYDNLSKYKWIFTKLGVYIDIVEIRFGIANGQILSIFDSHLLFSLPGDNASKYQWIFTKLGMCINIMEICFWVANGQISSFFDRVIWPQHIRILVSEQ